MQGQLPDGTVVAVKQLSSKSKQGNREFLNEIGMVSGEALWMLYWRGAIIVGLWVHGK